MTRQSLVKVLPMLMGLAGLAGALALFLWQGMDSVLTAFTAAGFGTVIAALAHFLPMTLNARAWQILLPKRQRLHLPFFVWLVWLRESVNGLLPVARIGGEVATARAMMRRGVGGPLAVASLVLDITISLGSQLVFTLGGVALLIVQGEQEEALRDLAAGLFLVVPLIVVFVAVQRAGLFAAIARLAQSLFGDRFQTLAGGAKALDLTIKDLYNRRTALLFCFIWQCAGWCMGGFEIWLCLRFLGHPLSLIDAVIIESIIQAISSAAFVVPGALGVQEGGFMLAGSWLGLPHDIALALALMRRARDVLIFVPALGFWQSRGALKLWRRYRSKNP